MPSPPLFDEFDGTNVGTYSNIIYLIKKIIVSKTQYRRL